MGCSGIVWSGQFTEHIDENAKAEYIRNRRMVPYKQRHKTRIYDITLVI